MPLRFGTETVSGIRIGDETPAGIAIGDQVVYQAGPPPVQFALYMNQVSGPRDTLFTVDRTTGVVTQHVQMNVRATSGLAWDGTNAFTLDRDDYLLRLNLATGVATRVGSATNYGISGLQGTGLAWDDTTMYMTGTDSALYTLDRTTGVATLVGRLGHTPTGDLTWDGTNLYILGSDALYTVNRTTGAVTRVGSASAFGVGAIFVDGLAWDGTNLFMCTRIFSPALYTVSRTTGLATQAGSATNFGQRSAPDPSALLWAPV